jgi:4-amino-4-deoxy-L-arabinose transferase-like glycosyltransferase
MDSDQSLGYRGRSTVAHPWKAALLVFALAFALRAGVIAFHPAPPFQGDMITYEGIAKNILDGRWHFGWGDLPSAHREPVYPLFIAGIYSVAGPSREAVHWAHAVLCSLSCALLVLLSSILLRSRRAALLAGMLAVIYPPFLLQVQTVLSEPLATVLLLLAVYLIVSGWIECRRGLFLLGGLFLGLATLTRASNLMYAPLIALAIILFPEGRRRIGLKGAMLFAAVFIAVLSPWTARNYAVFGRFIPVGVNAGGSFFRGNYDEGTLGSMGTNYHPDMPEEITAQYEGLDEVDIDGLLMREGMKYVRENPGTFVKLCALKFTRFWLNIGFADPPSRTSVVFAMGNGLLLLLALYGVLGSGLAVQGAAWPVYLLVPYYTALHVLLFATARYSVPVMPYVLCFSAAGIAGIANRVAPGLFAGGDS